LNAASAITGLSHIFTSLPLAEISFRGGMQTRDWLLLIGLLLSLVIAGLSAAAETALTSVNRIRIRQQAEEGDATAKRIDRLMHEPHLFITTILIMSNLSVITASTIATLIAIDLDFNGAEVASTIILSIIVLIFCEITPKSAAVRAPERWSRVLVTPVEWLMVVLRPFVALFTWISNGIIRLLGGKPGDKTPFVTQDELRLMVEVGGEEGVLEEDESEMLGNVFDLAETTVREVMIPRIDIVAVEADVSIDEATHVMLQGGQSRIPVYDDTLDEVIGLLYAKDLLRVYTDQERPISVRALVRPAYFVPESKRLDDLLRELRKQRVHMAIVSDEYGSVVGLVTIEDLVEEIVGDIQDEYDVEEALFERVRDNEYIIDAKLPVEEFDELVGRELPEGDYETLGGFVIAQLDKIPITGDVVHFEDLTITVLGTKGRRVTKVRVMRQSPEELEAAQSLQETQEASAGQSGETGNAERTEDVERAPLNGAEQRSLHPDVTSPGRADVSARDGSENGVARRSPADPGASAI
jgi:magnesium and cobalt exporter, CNNM family